MEPSSMARDVSAYAERSEKTVEGKVDSSFLLPLPSVSQKLHFVLGVEALLQGSLMPPRA